MKVFKPIAIAVVGVVLLTIGVALPAGAEVVVSVKGGLFLMEKNKYGTQDTGLNYGFSIQYIPPLENRVLDVGVEYMTGKVRHLYQPGTLVVPGGGGTANSFQQTGNIRYDAIIGTAHYRPPISASIQPYIGGGLGMYLFSPYFTGALGGFLTQPPPTQARTGYNFDVGVDFRLSPHWIVGLEYRYVSAHVSSSNNLVTNSWLNNLNFMTTTAAIRYAF